ncbi:MAG: hypothetical protein ACJATT_004722 [Myxococcota bacterium]
MLVLFLAGWVSAQETAAPPEIRAVVPEPAPTASPLRAIALVQSKFTSTDIATTNPFLDGQVIGPLGGINQTTVSDEDIATYTEWRVAAFFTWSPAVLSGRASLTAAIESDFAFGDRSYGTGGNTGGGFGADMVNLQTRRLHATFKPLIGDDPLTVHVGLQFLTDGAYDPTAATPDDLFRSGGRLMFFGSEATGVSAYGQVRDDWGTRLHYRAGAFTLWESGLGEPDDVTLYLADAVFHPAQATNLGLHMWYLRDRGLGAAGGAFGSGITSTLSELQGGAKLDFREDGETTQPQTNADLFWVGAEAGYDHSLSQGALGATGMGFLNLGSLRPADRDATHVRGMLLDGEVRFRYARGKGSVARAEAMFTTADTPGGDYTGTIGGNSYGLVGALNTTHGSLILFPDPFAINRYISVVHDPSFGGQGVLGLSSSVGFDPIPNRLTTQVGVSHARSGGENVGTEINGRIVGSPLLFLNTGLYGGAVFGTDLPATPWTVYAGLDWVMF